MYFLPTFEVHLCTVTFGLIYGQYSRAVSNQERVIVAQVRYINVKVVLNEFTIYVLDDLDYGPCTLYDWRYRALHIK